MAKRKRERKRLKKELIELFDIIRQIKNKGKKLTKLYYDYMRFISKEMNEKVTKKYRYAKAAPCVQAVIFARVSTKEQEPGASLKAQKEAMEDYCNKIGLPIVQKYT